MALFDRDKTKGFYTELGNVEDECFFCRKKIEQRRVDKEIDRDEMYAEIKKLRGKLTNQKIVRIQRAGTTICICKECEDKIHAEMNPIKEEPVKETPPKKNTKGKNNGED